MARGHIAAAAACFVVALFVLLQSWHYESLSRPVSSFKQWVYDTSGSGSPGEHASSGDYLIGVGKADITGPVVEINLMGYADPKQLGSGLKQRLYCRAFIIGSKSDPHERLLYLVLDTQSGDTAIRYGILEGLKALGDEYSVYRAQNVAVTGTHSHSGPGAWLNYLLPQITSRGFDRGSYDAIVSGAILAIVRAHTSLQPGFLEVASGDILDTNINRSPFAYLANPQTERDRYEYDVDKVMTLLKFTAVADDKPLGSLNWFPVHGTSMLGNNTLISGDNKGVAAYLLERQQRDIGNPDYVAGFSQANVGDTSPNILGAFCEDDVGGPCSFERSLCANNKSEACHGRGPFFGLDDGGMRSCYEIGRRQFNGAYKLIETNGTRVSGPVRSLHTYRDFSNYTFTLPNGTSARTCSAALGYSFAAGTTDGPGAFDFKQHSNSPSDANPLWQLVSKSLHNPSKEQVACQAPKPILLDVGATMKPYAWTPNIVDIQIFRVGQLLIIVAPGEATTMAGRRWRESLARSAASSLPLPSPIVVLGGPANTYSHYIATEEEYGVQRYEGASTLYGPQTLAAYINMTTVLLPHLADSAPARQELAPGPQPPINVNRSLSFIQPVVFDRAGLFKKFGDLVVDVSSRPYRAGDIVNASFIGANPRSNYRQEGTFAMVETVNSGAANEDDGELKERVPSSAPYLTDADWALTYAWRRTSSLAGTSEVTLAWEIEPSTPAGSYRLVYFGDAKPFGGGEVNAFVGRSGVFTVSEAA